MVYILNQKRYLAGLKKMNKLIHITILSSLILSSISYANTNEVNIYNDTGVIINDKDYKLVDDITGDVLPVIFYKNEAYLPVLSFNQYIGMPAYFENYRQALVFNSSKKGVYIKDINIVTLNTQKVYTVNQSLFDTHVLLNLKASEFIENEDNSYLFISEDSKFRSLVAVIPLINNADINIPIISTSDKLYIGTTYEVSKINTGTLVSCLVTHTAYGVELKEDEQYYIGVLNKEVGE